MKKGDKAVSALSVAMFGHKRMPSREGGIEIVVEELSTRMVNMGYKVTCYNRRGHHVSGKQFDVKKIKEYRGVRLKNLPTLNWKGLAAVTSSFFGTVYTAFGNYDVVHIHAEGPAFMCWLPKFMGKKVVVTIHGLDWKRAKWGKLAGWYIHAGEKNAVRYADEIIALSQNVKRYFKEVYGREIVFIPNGVDRSKIVEAKEITKLWGLKKNEYILFLGRLVPEKGVHYLIEAYSEIKEENSENLKGKKLVIAGGASDTNNYMNRLKSMSKDVIFTGFQQGRVLEELYSNAYIYCLPSDLEGMPLSLLEALSYGNCCLVSSIKECTEVVEDKAVVFNKSDVHDLKKKLKKLCGNIELVEKYKSTAADFICNKYNWDDVIDKTLELYR